MTKRSLSSRMPISPGILLVSTIKSGLTRPDRNCTSRSVPPASTLAIPGAPARILTASSTLVGAAKLKLGMFAPEYARAHLNGPAKMSAPHWPLVTPPSPWREELCSKAPILRPPLPKTGVSWPDILAGHCGDSRHAKQIRFTLGGLAQPALDGVGRNPHHAPHVDANHRQDPLGAGTDD